MFITKSDQTFLLRLMRKYRIPRLLVDWSESRKVHPDIWIRMGATPVITVTKEWARQDTAERRKRLVHEVVGHLALGLEHGVLDGKVFSTYPDEDEWSSWMYRRLK